MRTKSLSAALVAAAVCLLIAIFVPRWGGGVPPKEGAAAGGHSASRIGDSGSMTSGQISFFSCEQFGVSASTSFEDPGRMILTTFEVVPENFATAPIAFAPNVAPGEYSWSVEISSAFSVDLISPRHAYQAVVGGHPIDQQGELSLATTLLEEWTVTPALGAPIASRPKALTPLGFPAPHSPLTIGLQGQEYLLPQDRAEAKVTRRFIGVIPIQCTAIQVDPDGRYLLLVSADGEGVYQLDLTTGGSTPSLIAGAAQHPALAFADAVRVGRTTDGVKRYVVSCEDPLQSLVLFSDAQNDGLFETIETFTEDEYDATGYFDGAAWAEDYIGYRLEIF